MATTKRSLRVVRPGAPATPALPPTTPSPRRMLHRVETALMDLRASVSIETEVYHGHLLNLSVGGCCVRLPLPLTLTLDAGATIKVALMADDDTLLCNAELAGLTMGKGAANVRLRFQSLHPYTRRALIAWVGQLVRRELQLRYTRRDQLRPTPGT